MVYDASFSGDPFTWKLTSTDGTPIALSFATDNHRFAAATVAARDGQLRTTVRMMNTNSDTAGPFYVADTGSVILKLKWISSSRVLAVFDTYAAIINVSDGTESARYDYGGATLQSVSIGGRSTALMIDYIGETNATFVTNGIAHAKRLLKKNLRTYMIGGLVKPITEAIIGAEAVNSMKKFNFTKCFLGTNGIHMDYGFTTVDVEEAMVKMEAVNRSYASIVLADSSKFDKVTAVTFAAIEKACIITDRLVNDKYIDATVVKEVLR